MFHLILPGWDADELSLPISLFLFGTQDYIWLWFVAIAIPVSWWVICWRGVRSEKKVDLSQIWVSVIALLVIAFAVTATQWVYRDFALSMDEFMVQYQSTILLNGYLVAPVDPEWLSIARAQRPGFLIVDAEYQYWAPGYRPGTAILYAMFSAIGIGWIMNAVFCGASVILVAAIARQTLPNMSGAAIWAAIFLASSPQFLITGITPYTMTAHLVASLLWLYLFTLDRLATHVLAMAIGAFALGLHQINVHAMFALPFLVHLFVWRGRRKLAASYALTYAIALGLWTFWMDIAAWLHGFEAVEIGLDARNGGGAEYLKHAVSSGLSRLAWENVAYWMMNLSRFLAWQNAIVFPFLMLALASWRHLPVQLKLIALSVVTTLAPYIALMPDQGHGWGYRYLHPVLGNIAILAAFGLLSAVPALSGRLRRLAVWITAITILLSVPLRAYQVNDVVERMVDAMAYLTSRRTDIVLVDTRGIWYGNDLVRNDPFLTNTPIILSASDLSDERLTILCDLMTVDLVGAEDLKAFGIKPFKQARQTDGNAIENTQIRLERLGCNY